MIVNFYLMEIDEDFSKDMPCRINVGDMIHISDFISKRLLKTFNKEQIEYIEGDEIQYVVNVSFGLTSKGDVTQNANLHPHPHILE